MKDIAKMREWLRSVGADPSKLNGKGEYEGGLLLDNNQLTEVSFPEGMVIGGNLCLYNNQLTEVSFPEGMVIGGGLSLDNNQLTEVSFPEGMVIGGSLWLYNNQLTEVSFPEGMVIGGNLCLYNNQLTEVSFPEGMVIGGGLSLDNNQLTEKVAPLKRKDAPAMLCWQWRDRLYIKADGIFQEVVSHKGNVYRVKSIGSDKITYLVTDGDNRWAHGETLQEAKDDLIYKISNRDTSKYESLTLDSVLTFEEAIQCYRTITGACAAGTKGFVTSLPEVKEQYSIREIIDLTYDSYGGHKFAEFFNK